MRENQAFHSIGTMCRVLGLSRSGYHAWLVRAPSRRAQCDAELQASIVAIHKESDGTYGVPRIHPELIERGERVGRKRVARLMRAAGVRGTCRRRRFVVTTIRDKSRRPAPDLVNRKFVAESPNQLWVADITHIPTRTSFLYLAVVLDAWSRRIVGWSMATRLKTELVLAALEMALEQRRPENVIHHSDQGSQYTAIDFGDRCWEAGVRPSMGSVGDCYDNAMCESFFATLECELLNRRSFATPKVGRRAVFEFIEGWYNPRRRHSGIGYLAPMEYERRSWPRAEEQLINRNLTVLDEGYSASVSGHEAQPET